MATINTGATRILATRTAVGIMMLVTIQLVGCVNIGPATIDRDRFEYISAISESWKQQTLLNLVKLRYLDAPVFMDVVSVINQYSLEGEIEAGLNWSSINQQSLGGLATWSDRPTITYEPIMGEKFARSLLKPIPIPAILLLVQSGYPIDTIMRICTQSINGLENLRNGPIAFQNADTEFFELFDLLRSLQKMDGMAIRSQIVDSKNTLWLVFRPPENETAAGNLSRVRNLLGLGVEICRIPVVHGGFHLNNNEIAILNRSLMQVMIEYAAYIDVPQADIVEERVYASNNGNTEAGTHVPPLTKVHSGTSKPEDAFVSVFYRDHWFWIDDRDIYSKAMFQFLMTLFSFTESGESERMAPVITVPTN